MRSVFQLALSGLLVLALGCGEEEAKGNSQDVAGTDTSEDQAGSDVAGQDQMGNPDGVSLDDVTGDQVESALAAPEGIVVSSGRVFVTNANGVWSNEENRMVYGPGYVTVLDEGHLFRVGHIDLGCKNPQYAVADNNRVYVVCSGTVTSDENWVMTPAEAGKLVRINAETMEIEKSIELPIGTPSPMVGFPGSLCVDSQTDRIFVGAATGPFVYVVEEAMEEAPQVVSLYEMAGGNDSVTVECGVGMVWAVSFNTGDLYSVSASTLAVEEMLSVTETDQLEGPTDLLWNGTKLYVLNTISSKVGVVDLETKTVTFPVVTGATPNRLAMLGTVLYVVNSTDNNLTRYDTMSGDVKTPFGAMPTGTNPWEMAISGEYGFVTGYMSNTVIQLNLSTEAIVTTAGNPTEGD